MNQLIIFTKNNSQRFEYIVDFIFNVVLGIEYVITTSESELNASLLFKINYSAGIISSADITIVPHTLLDETTIEEQKILISTWKNLPSFFTSGEHEIPFDIFSACFYLISRYEEYLPYTPDLYQRFPAENSLAFKHNFLSIPLVDFWINELKQIIQQKNKAIRFKEKRMTFIPTYDIDIAYSYLAKGLKRNLGGSLKDLLSGKISAVIERLNVLSGKQKDPFDSFLFLDELHKKYQLHPVYFFLLSKGGEFDKNNSISHSLMKSLIEKTKAMNQIGIHPSYQSNESKVQLKKEIDSLQSNRSRQHYIRFALPATFRNLIEYGIHEEYSMGYGSTNGFRASTSHPYQWFDIKNNCVTGLKLFPFCYMECNSFFEQKFSVDDAYQEMLHYHDIVEQANGTLITIWHNFSLGSDPHWKGWKEMYEEFIKQSVRSSIPEKNMK